MIDTFIAEVLPMASASSREQAGDLIMTTLSTVGNEFSRTRRTKAEIKAYADEMADMFCAYLKTCAGRPRGTPSRNTRTYPPH